MIFLALPSDFVKLCCDVTLEHWVSFWINFWSQSELKHFHFLIARTVILPRSRTRIDKTFRVAIRLGQDSSSWILIRLLQFEQLARGLLFQDELFQVKLLKLELFLLFSLLLFDLLFSCLILASLGWLYRWRRGINIFGFCRQESLNLLINL